jgi:hypothetical protein
VEAPSRNHIWVSGTWIDQDDRYAWRPGYWEPGQENWTWIPAHYQWTRRGYVFIDGYWDYDVDRRGVVFAPVRFQRGYYDRPNFSYTPVMVISLNVFANHLFVRPNYGHYYFGDYYAPRYRDEGYYTSFSYRTGRGGYDPIYAQSRWIHRDDRNWEQNRRENFDYYRDNEDARPPHTWAAMQSRPVDRRGGKRDDYQLAAPLNQYVSSPKSGQRFAAVTPESRSKILAQRQQVREFSKGRQQLENRPNPQAAQGADKVARASREKLAKSPVMAKRAEQLSGRDAPPKRLEPKASEIRGGKGAALNGNAGKNPDGVNQARQLNPDARGENRGKNAESAIKPKDSPAGRPAQGPDSNSKRKDGADPKSAVQPQGRPAAKADVKPGGKPATDPRGRTNEPAQPQKQAVPPARKPQPAQKAEPKPERKPEPQTTRQPQPGPLQKAASQADRKPEPQQRQKAAPQPERKPEPQTTRQPQPEQRQKAAPQPERKPQPQTTRQPQPQQRQKAAPQPEQQIQRQAQPQRQQTVQPQQNRRAAPTQVAPGGKKKPGEEEEDPASKKGR